MLKAMSTTQIDSAIEFINDLETEGEIKADEKEYLIQLVRLLVATEVDGVYFASKVFDFPEPFEDFDEEFDPEDNPFGILFDYGVFSFLSWEDDNGQVCSLGYASSVKQAKTYVLGDDTGEDNEDEFDYSLFIDGLHLRPDARSRDGFTNLTSNSDADFANFSFSIIPHRN